MVLTEASQLQVEELEQPFGTVYLSSVVALVKPMEQEKPRNASVFVHVLVQVPVEEPLKKPLPAEVAHLILAQPGDV